MGLKSQGEHGRSRPRKQRADWLEAGLDILCVRGEQALTIDALCQVLSVTKGSFYHHFRDRDDYCAALLSFVEEADTSDVIRRAEAAGPDPRKRILALTAQTGRLRKDLEPSLRSWAIRDVVARRAQGRIDRRRIHYLEDLFAESGLPAGDARAQALTVYAVYLGASLMQPPLRGAELRSLYRRLSETG